MSHGEHADSPNTQNATRPTMVDAITEAFAGAPFGFNAPPGRTPRQRWGTCCPRDPECDHSYISLDALAAWMDTPISDERAVEVAL